jgi:hypothetical protein
VQRHALQVVAGRAGDRELLACLGAVALGRHRDLAMPREVLSRQRMRGAADVVGRALGHHLSAVLAGAGPHVDHVVRGVDRVLVVLDHDDAVAEIAQVLERREQAIVVALVQADRGLVQHVHHAGQPRADLRREPDALRFAPGERFRRAVERKIVEPDVVQELQPAHDLLHDAIGDRGLLAVELDRAEEFHRALERQRGDLVDRPRGVAVTDLDEPCLALQPRTVAFRARLGVEVFRELLAHHDGIGLAIAALEIGNDPFERVLAHDGLAAVGQVREGDLLVAGAGKDDGLHALGQLRERAVDVEADMLGEALQELEVELVAPVPAADRA